MEGRRHLWRTRLKGMKERKEDDLKDGEMKEEERRDKER